MRVSPTYSGASMKNVVLVGAGCLSHQLTKLLIEAGSNVVEVKDDSRISSATPYQTSYLKKIAPYGKKARRQKGY
jgi:hypothetical protein